MGINLDFVACVRGFCSSDQYDNRQAEEGEKVWEVSQRPHSLACAAAEGSKATTGERRFTVGSPL